MAKANHTIDASNSEALKPKSPVSPPSNDWVKNDVPNRVIDLTGDPDEIESHVNEDVALRAPRKLFVKGNKKILKRINKNAGRDATGVKTTDAKNARDLAKNEINGLYEQMIKHGRMTLEKAIAIGARLTEIKATLKHGEFGNWIASSLDFNQKTAERYMNLHKGREKLKIDTMSNINNALRVLDEDSRARNPKVVKIVNAVKAKGDLQQPIHKIVHIDKDEALDEPVAGEVKANTPALDIVEPVVTPVLVASAPEPVLAELLDVIKRHAGKCQYQVIRKDGEIKLNQCFMDRLGLTA